MAVALRLTRMGRKKRPFYRIIAIDSRRSRDSVYLERLGYYHPLDDPAGIKIDAEKALKWLRVGAQPSDTVRSLFKREGIWMRFTLEKRGMPEKQIEETMIKWFAERATEAEAKTAEKQVSEETPSEKPAEDVKEVAKSDTPKAAKADTEETPSEKPAEEVKEAAKSDTPKATKADSVDKDAKAEKEAEVKDVVEAKDGEAKEASDTEEQAETAEKTDAGDDTKKEVEAPKE